MYRDAPSHAFSASRISKHSRPACFFDCEKKWSVRCPHLRDACRPSTLLRRAEPFFSAQRNRSSPSGCTYWFLLFCILSIFAPDMGFLCLLCRRLRCDILLLAILSWPILSSFILSCCTSVPVGDEALARAGAMAVQANKMEPTMAARNFIFSISGFSLGV